MRSLAYLLLQPLSVFWLLLIPIPFIRKKHSRLATYLLLIALLWLALASTPPLPTLLVESLERQYEPLLQAPSFHSPSHILVLGGGHVSDERLPPNDQLSEQALSRLVEGIRLHRLIPGSKLVLSGYARPGIPITQAEVLAKTAISLGINPKDTLMVTTPHNTRQEAIDYKKKFGSVNSLLLVTNAIHMPRAMMHFKRAGLAPTPAPTNHFIKWDRLSSRFSLRPSSGNLKRMNAALHEYVGFVWGKVEWYYEERGKNKKVLQ